MSKKIAMLGGMLLTSWAHAFVPQSGTWIIASELNGAPGRGLAIDVQEDTLVMQMYAYERSGQPTFYMSAGKLDDNRITTKLGRYAGGRHLGSGPMSGQEDGSPGNVTLRFTSGISGFITLPGESEVAIKRYEFGLSRTPASVAGTWAYVGIDSSDDFGDLVNLTQELGSTTTGTGFVADAAGKIGCEYRQVDEGPYNMFCGVVSGSDVTWIAKLKVVGNEGEGIALNPATGSQDGIVYVRKLRDGQGRFLGLFAPNAPQASAPVPSPTPTPTPTPTPAPAPTPAPNPAPSYSPYAGSYNVSGGGVSVIFTVNGDGSIRQCTSDVLVTCTGTVASSGSFSLTGGDGDGTTVTLSGSINSGGSISGTYLGTSDGETIKGSFTGSRSSGSPPPAAPAPAPEQTASKALAFCWQNDKKTLWWCDGYIQELTIGERDLNGQLSLAGCDSVLQRSINPLTLTHNRQNKSRMGWLYTCNYQLKSQDRDLRKIWSGIPSSW